ADLGDVGLAKLLGLDRHGKLEGCAMIAECRSEILHVRYPDGRVIDLEIDEEIVVGEVREILLLDALRLLRRDAAVLRLGVGGLEDGAVQLVEGSAHGDADEIMCREEEGHAVLDENVRMPGRTGERRRDQGEGEQGTPAAMHDRGILLSEREGGGSIARRR